MVFVLTEELEKQSILTPDHVLLLRQYIGLKYPNHGPKSQAMVFANAIHQILDRELSNFQYHIRQIIKRNLLQDLFSKEHFLLTAKDVFDGILDANTLLVQGFSAVTTWLSNRLNNVPKELLIQALDDHLNDYQKSFQNPNNFSEQIHSSQDVHPVSSSELQNHDYSKVPSINIRSSISILISYIQLAGIAAFIGFVLWIFTSGQGSSWMAKADEFVSGQIALIARPVDNGATINTESNSESVELLTVPPLDIQYKTVNPLLLAEWLTRRESYLAKKSYIDAILLAAKENDVNPLVLVAIAGQEQGFVPINHPQAGKIANNPFNVFGSWQGYNTTISDSAHIAARTVNRLSKNCPKDVDPLLWINRSYAEDPNWWRGVRDILTQLENDIQKTNQ